MGDATNHYETLDRSLKKIGIILVDDSGFLRNGKSLACVDLLRKLLLSTSVPTAKLLLQRGCPSHAPDRKLVAAAFELVRDKVKFLPSLTVDQFFKEGYAAHKLAILVKLTNYIAETDKAFAKAQPPKMMYVVPSEASQVSVSFKYEHGADPEQPEREEHESSLLDDVDVEVSYTDLPPAPASNPRPSTNSTGSNHTHATHYTEPPKAWPQTDFIKKHILDNSKLQNMNNSPARITAPKSRSTTPTSTRKSSSSMYGVDVYDIEEKTAALEAIQALRAARSGITTNNNISTAQPNTSYNYQSPNKYTTFSAESSPVFKNNNTLTELAAADLPHNTNSSSNTNNTSTNYTTNNTSGGANSADFQQFVQHTVDQAVAAKIEHDSVVQKLIDQRVEAIVEQRVSSAVQELTTKYDFIINKLVAAVDAEFTLLNNKLAMQQQQQPEY